MEQLIAQQRKGQLAAITTAVLFGCSAPLISTLTGEGSALSIAALLYAEATLGLLAVRQLRHGSTQRRLSTVQPPRSTALSKERLIITITLAHSQPAA